MINDKTKIGITAAKLMEKLDDDIACEIGEVMLIVECKYRSNGEEYGIIEYQCTDGRPWVQQGLLSFALKNMELIEIPKDTLEEDNKDA